MNTELSWHWRRLLGLWWTFCPDVWWTKRLIEKMISRIFDNENVRCSSTTGEKGAKIISVLFNLSNWSTFLQEARELRVDGKMWADSKHLLRLKCWTPRESTEEEEGGKQKEGEFPVNSKAKYWLSSFDSTILTHSDWWTHCGYSPAQPCLQIFLITRLALTSTFFAAAFVSFNPVFSPLPPPKLPFL